MHHAELVGPGERAHIVEREAVGRRVDQAGARHERGRLGEPGRIPERSDLAPSLVPRAGAPVEAVEGGRVQEERAKVRGHDGPERTCFTG